MKTIKSSKEITTLEVDDKIIFGNSEYKVKLRDSGVGYYLYHNICSNNTIFLDLHLDIESFCNHLGISILNKHHLSDGSFPETKSLEALTAIVSALFKEYEKQNELPKTWEEFCKRNPITPNEYWIETIQSRYCNSPFVRERDIDMDKNVCTSLQEAQAFTALMQLRQLRKVYVKDWEPDWTNNEIKYVLEASYNKNINVSLYLSVNRPFSFPTLKMAQEFLETFRDLIEEAKTLI